LIHHKIGSLEFMIIVPTKEILFLNVLP